jgi:hypothetical protein
MLMKDYNRGPAPEELSGNSFLLLLSKRPIKHNAQRSCCNGADKKGRKPPSERIKAFCCIHKINDANPS